jgi:hypothetical protein
MRRFVVVNAWFGRTAPRPGLGDMTQRWGVRLGAPAGLPVQDRLETGSPTFSVTPSHRHAGCCESMGSARSNHAELVGRAIFVTALTG